MQPRLSGLSWLVPTRTVTRLTGSPSLTDVLLSGVYCIYNWILTKVVINFWDVFMKKIFHNFAYYFNNLRSLWLFSEEVNIRQKRLCCISQTNGSFITLFIMMQYYYYHNALWYIWNLRLFDWLTLFCNRVKQDTQ